MHCTVKEEGTHSVCPSEPQVCLALLLCHQSTGIAIDFGTGILLIIDQQSNVNYAEYRTAPAFASSIIRSP